MIQNVCKRCALLTYFSDSYFCVNDIASGKMEVTCLLQTLPVRGSTKLVRDVFRAPTRTAKYSFLQRLAVSTVVPNRAVHDFCDNNCDVNKLPNHFT